MTETVKKKEKVNFIILVSLFALYLIFNGVLLAGHELWRDEVNVWLMARELSPLQLLSELKYQGHPCLWYLLVMPFAKLGLPCQTICILSYLVMGAAAGIFVWKAPMNPVTKAFCLFSSIFTYFYPVIARNYCLIALILMLLAWCYPKRNEKSILYGLMLGLLVQADTIAIVEAGLISLMWLCENLWHGWKERDWRECKYMLKGIWIPLASLGLWVLQFYQVSDSSQFQMKSMGLRETFNEIQVFSYGILIRLTGWDQKICALFLLLCLVILIILSVRLKNGWAFIVLSGAFLFQGTFSAIVYQLHIWHFLSLCFVFIWAVWILHLQMKEKQINDRLSRRSMVILEILVLLFAGSTFMNWNSENETSNLQNALHGVYSDGVYAAEFIEENISPDELIVTVDVAYASTVTAYLPDYVFYFAGNGKVSTYADWSEAQSGEISLDELMVWVETTFPDKKEFYLLDSHDSCLTDADRLLKYKVLYETKQDTAREEEYTIYRINLDS